jgi:hypothetical protein
MKPSTVDVLRAYLHTASLASVFIVTLALAALAGLGISDETFRTAAFRPVLLQPSSARYS